MASRPVPAVAVALAALTLAGCSGAPAPRSPEAGPSGPGSAAASPSSGAPAPTTTKAPGVVVPTKVPNRPRRRDQVRLTTCAAADGGWTAGGTAQARRAGAERFRITVFFTTDRATVVAWEQTTVEVAAGARADWRVTARLRVEGELRCVLRGVG